MVWFLERRAFFLQALVICLMIVALGTDPKQDNTESQVCPGGSYGGSCVVCPDKCQGDCNMTSGDCFGCKEDGQYGARCDQFCEHCNHHQCFYFDGTCTKGYNQTLLQEKGVKSECMTENPKWPYVVIGFLLLLNAILVVFMLHLCGVISVLSQFLPFLRPAWYQQRGLTNLRTDNIERSEVQDEPFLSIDC